MARPRKQNRNRYKNGRIIPFPRGEREQDVKRTALLSRMKHEGARDLKAANDQHYGTVLGILLLRGAITEGQHQAGDLYRRMRLRELSRQDAADRSPRNIRWGRIMARAILDEEDILPEEDDPAYDDAEKARRTADARAKHDALMERLQALDPPEAATLRLLRVVQLVDRVCLDNREIALTPANLKGLRRGLDVIMDFLKIEERRNG
jgi:hypothetical protein